MAATLGPRDGGSDKKAKHTPPPVIEDPPSMDPAFRVLRSMGFTRLKTDFDPAHNPRPLFVNEILSDGDLPACTIKAVVGPTWTTVWRMFCSGIIDEMESAKTNKPDDLECLIKLML